ncbi:hypothetical protein K438DRAFT_1607023 [Mycena galopus ATCC 62051]|nr:hypothetical protein K438DRAFT_1607023 [Mycena galopus ATCC 62051]
MHDAHWIGSYWKHIPECEDRVTCQYCGEIEDLEHIVLKCRHPGQNQVWALVKELWLKKHHTWKELSLGVILGCGLVLIKDENGRHLPGATRLFRILISESLFLIWKLHVSNGLWQQDQPNGLLVRRPEIQNKWLYTINWRLELDCQLTNKLRYGKQDSVNSILVLQTWSATLKDEDKLPDNWLRMPRF